jgi:hypothetical protein
MNFTVNGVEAGTQNSELKINGRQPLEITTDAAAYLRPLNGIPADTAEIVADGKINKVRFKHVPERSSWVALRIHGSAHTNPVFVEIDGRPVRVRKSAEWCRMAVEQCWKMKEPNIKKEEKEAARQAYEEAKNTYDNIIKESGQ